jgi:hypothetical protein
MQPETHNSPMALPAAATAGLCRRERKELALVTPGEAISAGIGVACHGIESVFRSSGYKF